MLSILNITDKRQFLRNTGQYLSKNNLIFYNFSLIGTIHKDLTQINSNIRF